MANSISTLIKRKIRELAQAAADAVVNESEQFGLVKVGSLQDNPVKYRIVATIHTGDPAKDDWFDSVVAEPDNTLTRYHLSVPSYEIGGGELWWRRFSADLDMFFIKTKENRDDAEEIAGTVRARVEHVIRNSTNDIAALVDSFGERALMPLVVRSTMVEGGGPPNQFIHRGKIWFQVLTEISAEVDAVAEAEE